MNAKLSFQLKRCTSGGSLYMSPLGLGVPMRIVILGGDGFCGWPTALHLSNLGHEIVIADNLSRRNIDNELETSSLTPICAMGERLQAWAAVSGRRIAFVNLTVGV